MGARERQQDKAQGTQRMQLLAVVIQGVGASQPMAEEDWLRRKGCAKGAIGKGSGRPRREGCAGVVLGERDLRHLAIFSDFLAALIGGLWYPYSCIYVREVAEYVGIG